MLTTSDIMAGKIVCQLGLAQPDVVRQVLREVDWDASATQDLLNRLVAQGAVPEGELPRLRHRVGLYQHVRREALYLRMLERQAKVAKEVVAGLISELERSAYRRRLGDVLVRSGKLTPERDQAICQAAETWMHQDDARIMERYRGQDFEGVGRPLIPHSRLEPEDFKISTLFRSRETRALVEKAALRRLRQEAALAEAGMPQEPVAAGEGTHRLPAASEIDALTTPRPAQEDEDEQATFRQVPDAGGFGMKEVLALKRIADYAVVETLGTGGMGAVFLGQKDGAGEFVAIKVLLTEAASELERGRFQREIELNRKVQHANVIHIIDAGTTPEGLEYLIVPALAGKELRDYLEAAGGQGLAPELVLSLMQQILAGMQAVHDQGIVHRDLKPENVFVLAGGEHQVKIMDFGVAKQGDDALSDLNSFRSNTSEACGSPAYIAPESVTNDAIDARTDIYSLGIMLFELLTGKLPLESETAQGFLTQHMICPPLTLKEACPERSWPAGLEELLERMMGKSLEERPASCAEVWQTLEGLRDELLAAQSAEAGPSPPVPVAGAGEQSGEYGFKGLLGRLWGKA